ncbi:hypothetical protein UFOVP1290_120 [uncultured Caudovirales phage]|uniref:Uncharacterized protein n=1 Tax=uncultured Caudovirales phage TaxID=2100421 RepID=A0A6J5RGB8_9CAUD|nr:hypothetical protein UFOVP1290_120 [uncultured Caudovirales phage]
MKHICPICQSEMTSGYGKIIYQDFSCRKDLDNHIYLYRYYEAFNKANSLNQNSEHISELKFRLTESDGFKLYVKIYYDQYRSEVWTKTNDNKRINIPKIITLDFSDLDKLKSKIKTYLIFS